MEKDLVLLVNVFLLIICVQFFSFLCIYWVPLQFHKMLIRQQRSIESWYYDSGLSGAFFSTLSWSFNISFCFCSFLFFLAAKFFFHKKAQLYAHGNASVQQAFQPPLFQVFLLPLGAHLFLVICSGFETLIVTSRISAAGIRLHFEMDSSLKYMDFSLISLQMIHLFFAGMCKRIAGRCRKKVLRSSGDAEPSSFEPSDSSAGGPFFSSTGSGLSFCIASIFAIRFS